MSATITWSIKHMHTVNDSQPNIVQIAMVSVTAAQDGMQATIDEPVRFERPTDDFTPYDQLTEAQVLQWVFDILTPEGVAQRENGANFLLQSKLNPDPGPILNVLPWTTG